MGLKLAWVTEQSQVTLKTVNHKTQKNTLLFTGYVINICILPSLKKRKMILYLLFGLCTFIIYI